MKKIFVIAATLLVSVAAFAQETNKDAEGNTIYGPYETNSFFDNWFLEVGGGLNFTWLNIGEDFGNKGLAVQANIGKWLTPEYGIRAGYHGLKNEIKGYENAINDFHYAKADYMVNISNLFGGYKENRTWEFIPFAGAGALMTKTANPNSAINNEWALEAGLINNIRLGSRVDFNVELGWIVGRQNAYVNAPDRRFIHFPYATAGLGFNLGRTNWTRKASTIAAYTAAVAAAEAAAKAAQAGLDAANAAKNAADAKAKALADENARLKNELANAAGKDDFSVLFDEPIIAYFKLGSAKLSEAEKAHLEYAVKNIISRGDNVKFTLTGSADSKTGSKRVNQVLSEKRADTVYKLMTEELGISGDRFTIQTKGGNLDFNPFELNRCVIIEKQ